MSSLKIPILLLKTKSIPNDGYEEHFSSPNSLFAPVFVPVLEHKPNITNLERVRTLLQEGELNRRYGGMIFTSQRAVEGFAQVVQELERGRNLTEDEKENILEGNEHSELGSTQSQLLPFIPFTTSSPIFPLYTVGPATSRSLRTLLSTSPTILYPLQPEILGSDTGNGEALAKYILEHYRTLFQLQNQLYTSKISPPPPPPSSSDDANAKDRNISQPSLPPLLFLVGEQRRDIIPKTLMSPSLPPDQQIQVEELVVYGTGVMESFPADLDRALRTCQDHASTGTTADDIESESNTRPSNPSHANIVVIVIFSPSGSKELLQRLRFPDKDGKVAHPSHLDPSSSSSSQPQPVPVPNPNKVPRSNETEPNNNPPSTEPETRAERKTKYIIATIGPTTYNHLATAFGYQAHICADTPSPEGVGKGVETFLRGQGLLRTN